MTPWIGKLLKAPREIGAIAPSSSFLGELMTETLPRDASVLEIGPGTGAITDHIVMRLASESQLTLVELDEQFASHCRERFSKATVIWNDAELFLQTEPRTYEYILSGVPFGAMGTDKHNRLLNLIHARLAPGGSLIMFQYSIRSYAELVQRFDSVKMKFMPWNLPPAVVFVATTRRGS